jgi:hypothetical protein
LNVSARTTIFLLLTLASLSFTGCGGGGDGSTPTYTVGGSVSGLLPGASIGLTVTGGGAATVSANGSFTLNIKIASGTHYTVSIATSPTAETCTVSNGTGTVSAVDINNVGVVCSANTYAISALVFGLVPNSTLVLQDNGTDRLTATTGGTQVFQTSVASGSPYAVTVNTQPSGQSCSVTGGAGTVAATNVTVTVVCPWHVLYIPDTQDNAILGYYIDPSTGSLLSLPSNALGAPSGLSSPVTLVASGSKFLYAANQGSNSVAGFGIDPSTGALTPLAGSPFVAGPAPRNVVIDSTGSFLYVANLGVAQSNGTINPGSSSSISSFAIDPTTGALTSLSGSPLATPTSPSPLIADPAGDFLFAATGSYTIDRASGALAFVGSSTPMGCANTQTATQTCAAAARTTGDYLYVGEATYAINTTTGGFSVASTGLASSSVVVAPDNEYLYLGGGSIGVDAISSGSGIPSPIPGSPFQASDVPINPVTADGIDPGGGFLYITTSEGAGIFGYSLSSSTGAPHLLAGSPFTGLKYPGVYGPGGYSIQIVALP